MWKSYEGGKTLGSVGSEDGVIIRDEECSKGARLTLEADGKIAPFTVTTGIYGSFFHTTFLSARNESEEVFEAIKKEIDEYLSGEKSQEWIESFINRY
ncbi:MAG: hypothetical protein K6L73_02040 [Cellvibrionaceae bacterium]